MTSTNKDTSLTVWQVLTQVLLLLVGLAGQAVELGRGLVAKYEADMESAHDAGKSGAGTWSYWERGSVLAAAGILTMLHDGISFVFDKLTNERYNASQQPNGNESLVFVLNDRAIEMQGRIAGEIRKAAMDLLELGKPDLDVEK